MNEEQRKQVGSTLESLKQTLNNMSKSVSSMSSSQRSAASQTLGSISNVLSGISSRVSSGGSSTPAPEITATSEPAAASSRDVYDQMIEQNRDFQERIERQYQEEARLLQDQYRARSSDIRAEAESARLDTERRQQTDTARLSRDIASAGGYLGGSISATSTMLGLSQDQRTELFRLQQERDRLMRDAELDFRAGRTQMLRDKMESLMQIQSREMDLMMAQDERRYSRAQDRLQMIQGTDPVKLDANTLATLSRDLGMTPEAVADYLFVAHASAQAKSAKEQLEYNKSLISLLQSLPYGEEIEMPDGTVYTGLGDTDDYYFTSATDNNGNLTVMSFDKRTGAQVSRSTTPGVGRVYSSGGGAGDGLPSDYFPDYPAGTRRVLKALGVDPTDRMSAAVIEAGGSNFQDWLLSSRLTPDDELGFIGPGTAEHIIRGLGASTIQHEFGGLGVFGDVTEVPTAAYSAADYQILFNEWKPLYGPQTYEEQDARKNRSSGFSNKELAE